MKLTNKLLVWGSSALILSALCYCLIRRDRTASVSRQTPSLPISALAHREAIIAMPAASQSPLAKVSPAVAAAWTNAPYARRKKALLRLGKDLSPADCQFLSESLRSPMSDAELNTAAAEKNTVMDVLRGQRNLPEPYPRLLVDLFKDSKLHLVTRDYALQHLVDWYAENPRQEAMESARDEVRGVLWSALSETQPTIAGTALLGLQYLSDHEPKIEVQKIGAAALAIATNGCEADHSRLTAFQVCSHLQVAEVLPSARTLAQSGRNIPLRAAAIATLGKMGGEMDLKLLQSMDASQSNGALKPAISSAITHLTYRNKG